MVFVVNLVGKVKDQLSAELIGEGKYTQESWKVTPITDSEAGNCNIQQDCSQCPAANQCFKINFKD